MAQINKTYRAWYAKRISERERLVLAEIGRDRIDTASSFVDYMNDFYGIPKSSLWYLLNVMKRRGMLDFASKGESGKGLYLTSKGLAYLGGSAPYKAKMLLDMPAIYVR
ncbi:MAG: hypothetical protein QXF41_02730 [Candidatus Micrarchaeaceae archaeon]